MIFRALYLPKARSRAHLPNFIKEKLERKLPSHGYLPAGCTSVLITGVCIGHGLSTHTDDTKSNSNEYLLMHLRTNI